MRFVDIAFNLTYVLWFIDPLPSLTLALALTVDGLDDVAPWRGAVGVL